MQRYIQEAEFVQFAKRGWDRTAQSVLVKIQAHQFSQLSKLFWYFPSNVVAIKLPDINYTFNNRTFFIFENLYKTTFYLQVLQVWKLTKLWHKLTRQFCIPQVTDQTSKQGLFESFQFFQKHRDKDREELTHGQLCSQDCK